ncbi:unnamed protein product [Camellia sinensis]
MAKFWASPLFLIVVLLLSIDSNEVNGQDVKCCFDNHIGSCVPGTPDESACDKQCRDSGCGKGGRCK